MGTAERREREREQMHDAIVDAAVELFLNEGFEQTSIRRIAERIEYTPGAIYSYFKDKDEILYNIHLRGFSKLFDVLKDSLSEPDPLARLYRIGQLYLKFALENPQYYDLMFIDRTMTRRIEYQKKWECGHQAHDLLRQIVAECMEKHRLPDGDVDAASYTFWSSVHGLVALVLRGRCIVETDDYAALIQQSYDYLWSTMRKKD